MALRTNTNPHGIALSPELQDILQRNGMQAQVVMAAGGYALMVQSHDSPVLQYAITERQLKTLTDWGTNTANKRAYNTFASIIAADFDLPKNFVHARNANGRVAMGLHGYRIGVGEYGRTDRPMPFRHMHGNEFLGWTPRMQDGYHLRRIGGQLYYAGAPMVAERADGRMKPGELQSGGYGFYYKPQSTAQQAPLDVVQQLQTALPAQMQRPTEAKPYNEVITSDVYFTNEKWQEVLASHGLLLDATAKTLTVQSASIDADLQYTLTDEELKTLTANTLTEADVAKRLETINKVIGDDFQDSVTMELLNSKQPIDIHLHPEVLEDLNKQLDTQQQYIEQENQQETQKKGTVEMNGNDLDYLNPDKGWYREGRHGREVTVDNIKVEPAETQGKYKMSAVIDGEVVSHEITQKQYDKFMAVDDYHRFQLFSKIFKEVDMKDRNPVGLGTKITAALMAGATVTHEVLYGPHMNPEIYADRHGGEPRVYFKPGVDSPADVAARRFDAMVNNPAVGHGPGLGM
jgi:hypothetical protein